MAEQKRAPDPRPDDTPDRIGRGTDEMELRQAGHSLKERSADQIRNEQRGGTGLPPDWAGPEANRTMQEVWSDPGGEPANLRSGGGAGKSEGHSDATAAETPQTHRHLSDPTLGAKDKDGTGKAREGKPGAGKER